MSVPSPTPPELHLAAIVDSSDDAIVSKTLDGIITSWNRAAERMFGYTAAEAVGQSILLIIPRERWAEETEVLARLRHGERIDHFETVRQAKDGRLLDISLTVSPVRDASGRIIGASKIARDITPARRAAKELQGTVETLETLYRLADRVGRAKSVDDVAEAAVDAIVGIGADRASLLLFDERGVMRFRAWRNLSGAYRAAVEGHSPWPPDAVAPAPITIGDVLVDRGLGALADVVAAEGIRSLVFVPLVDKERLLGKFMVYYDRPHAVDSDALRRAAVIAQHVAFGLGRVRAERAVEELLEREREARGQADAARAEAERLNQAKDVFLATLSHELRTPLNAILGWCRLLKTGFGDADTLRRALDTIDRNANIQAHLIEDLLDVSAIITGKLALSARPIDIHPAVEAAVDAVRPAAATKRVDLRLTPASEPLVVEADAARLQQIVWNLVTNAVKFTPEGGRVDVEVTGSAREAEIIVRDTGVGIEANVLPYIFDRFRQGNRTAEGHYRGLGLGLALVKHLVGAHGGRVRAESGGAGQGAVFTVTLPLVVAPTGERRYRP